MSNTPEDTELRRKISKMIEGISAGYHGEDGIDYIMSLITLHTEKRELDTQKYILLRTLESFDHYSGTGNALHDIRKDINKSIDCLDEQLTNPSERSE